MEKILSFAEVSRILEHDRLDPFLCDLRETGDGKLYILICRATAASEPEPDKWEIVFEDYILFAVDAGLLEHAAPWRHYGVFTQNQIIDIIAQAAPVIYQCM